MAKNVLAGWKKAVVYNPDTGDRVQLNKISAASSELPGDPNIKTETATGQIWGGQQWPLTIGFMDSSGLDLLQEWQDTETPVHLIIFTPAGMSIIFREPELIEFIPGTTVNAREGLKIHRVIIEAVGADLDVKQLKNLARDISFSGNVGSIIFPISNVRLTASATYASPDGASLVITAKDNSGSILATSSQTASAGRVTADILLPAETWSVEIDALDGGSGSVSDIALRGDDSAEFLSY